MDMFMCDGIVQVFCVFLYV